MLQNRILFTLLSISILSVSSKADTDTLYPEAYLPELRQLLLSSASNSTRVRKQEYVVEERQGDLLVARSKQWAKASLHSRLALAKEERISAEGDYEEANGYLRSNLRITQPLYHFGAIEAGVNMGNIRYEMALDDIQSAIIQTFDQVRNAYLDLLISRQKLLISEENVIHAQTLYKNQESLLEAGHTSEQIVLETKIHLRQQEESLLATQKRIEYLEEHIFRLTAYEGSISELAKKDFPSLDAFKEIDFTRILKPVEESANTRYLYLNNLADIESERLTEIGARNLPKFGLVAGVDQDVEDDYRDDGTNKNVIKLIAYAGVQVDWNIFDYKDTKGRKISSMARSRRLREELKEQGDWHDRENKRLCNEIKFNEQQMETRSERVKLLADRVSIYEKQQAFDLISLNRLIEARIQQSKAEIDLLNVKKNYLMNISRLYSRNIGDPIANSLMQDFIK